MPERMIEAGQANAAHHHAGGAPLVGGATGQGIIAAANAVSIGNKPVRGTPHGSGNAFTGIIEGAKKSIAAIKTLLTVLRKFMIAPAPIVRRLTSRSFLTFVCCTAQAMPTMSACGQSGHLGRIHGPVADLSQTAAELG
jgi:hypothetical protein